MSYAGFWVRLWAYIIDSVIVFFGLLIVRLATSGILSFAEGTFLGGNVLFHYTLKDIILYIFQVMYFILFTFCTGTTPGKRLLNLRVISAEGKELTFFDVLYRETIGRFLCGLTIGIGYLMAGIDREKRGIHDMLCDTRVVYAKKIKVYPSNPMYQVPTGYSAGYPAAPVVPPMPPIPPAPPVPRQVPPAEENTGEDIVRSVPQGNVPPQGNIPPAQNGMRPQDYNGPYRVTGSEENNGQERNS